MNGMPEALIFGLALMFCRVGGCMMIAPGFSSPRVPVQVRLFAAFAVTAALSPLVLPGILRDLEAIPPENHVFLLLRELALGLLLGLLARCFFLALQFSATAISNFIGLTGIPGIPLEEADTGSPLSTLVSSAAVTVVFVAGLHIELLKAVIESYSVMPLGGTLSANVFLANLLTTLSETWLLALRLAAPFLLYGVIVNFALGMGNRFAPQVSMYHSTTGIVMLGGFLLFYLIWMDWGFVFMDTYRSWLVEGGFAR
jgi:flagellar biosynthetic protein FliR